MKKFLTISVFVLLSVIMSQVAYALSWFSGDVSKYLDIRVANVTNAGKYEASGLVWNPVTNRLFAVSDDGQVTRMNLDGTGQETVELAYNGFRDFEAVTIVDPNSDKIYIGIEHPDTIIEVQWPEGEEISITKAWDLTGVLTGENNRGLEGLTFVPDAYHPYGDTVSGGLFYAGVQRSPILNNNTNVDDYLIYAFDIDLSSGGSIFAGDEIGIPVAPGTPNWDVSDLSFNKDTGILYVLYGGDRLIEMSTGGVVVKDYSGVPVRDQEGLAIVTNYPSATASVYIASDYFDEVQPNNPNNKLITWFIGYPVTYFDADGDGFDYISDGGFEDYGATGSSTDWIKYGVDLIDLSGEDFVEGEYSAHIDATGAIGGIQQAKLRVKAGKSYRLTVNHKLLSGKMKIFFGADTANADFENFVFEPFPKNIWEPYIRDITIPYSLNNKNGVSLLNADGTVKDFRLVIILQNGEVYLDDVSLEEIDESDKSLIYPLWTSNWKTFHNLPMLEEMLIGGQDPENSSWHLVAGDKITGIYQVVKVQGGHTYELSYDTMVPAGRIVPYLFVEAVPQLDDFENFVNPIYSSGHQNWTNVSRVFTIPQGADSMNVRFVVYQNSDVFLKNLTFKEIAENPYANEIVRDGNMESLNTGFWTNILNPEIKEKVNGTLHIKSRTGFNYGIFEKSLRNLKPNTTYTFSFDTKILAGSIKPVIGHNNANGDFEKSRVRAYKDPNNEWIHYSDTFTTVADPAKPYSLVIMAYKDNSDNFAEAFIDNVAISKVE